MARDRRAQFREFAVFLEVQSHWSVFRFALCEKRYFFQSMLCDLTGNLTLAIIFKTERTSEISWWWTVSWALIVTFSCWRVSKRTDCLDWSSLICCLFTVILSWIKIKRSEMFFGIQVQAIIYPLLTFRSEQSNLQRRFDSRSWCAERAALQLQLIVRSFHIL